LFTNRVNIFVAVAATWMIWGSTYLAIRISLEDMPPFFMAGSRFLVAGAALFGWLLIRGKSLPTLRQLRNAFLLAFLLLVMGHGGVVFAEQWVASSVAALAVASMPLWATLFARLFGRRVTRLDAIAIVIGFIGVVLLNKDAELRGATLAAIVLLIAPISWAFGSVVSGRMELPSGLMLPATEMLCGGVQLFVISLVMQEGLPQQMTFWPTAAWIYQIIAGSIIAFSAYLYLLKHARPALATSYAFVNPVIAVALGVALAGEHMETWGYAGMTIIVAAVAVITLQRGLHKT